MKNDLRFECTSTAATLLFFFSPPETEPECFSACHFLFHVENKWEAEKV